MGLFRFRWLRKMVRRHSKPIEEETASKWERRLSLMYMLFATNAFAVVCYMVFTGRADWAKYYGFKKPEDDLVPKGVQWAKTLGINKATVVKIKGFTKVDEYEIVDKEKVVPENEKTTV